MDVFFVNSNALFSVMNGEIPKKYLGKAEEQTFHVAVDEFLHNHNFVQRDYCSGICNEEK